MGNPAGVKRDFAGLERRRMAAAKLLQQGVSQAEVARRLGVHRQSVIRWVRELRQSGRARPVSARRGPTASARGPQALGYETALWTAPRVARLIEQRCGVRYHPAHVWRLLGQLGWSCQRPAGRALERDEAAIQRWKQYRWPQLKKKPAGRAKPSSSSTRAG